MDAGRWYISQVKARCFKSFGRAWVEVDITSAGLVGIVGANGTGKSTLLQCILFASGASVSELGVKTLKELCNSSITDQLCEVEIQISNNTSCAKKQRTGQARAITRAFTIRAALASDGARQFQIDGKNKTGQQVKEHLRSLGVSLDTGTSVIHQATVTQLADSNTPEVIGKVLARASGLDRWEGETSKAKSEVEAAKQAMTDITSNVTKLEAMIKADNARVEQLEQLQQLQDEQRKVAGSLVLAYDHQRKACTMVLEQTEAELQEAKASLSHLEVDVHDVEDRESRLNHDLDDKSEQKVLSKRTMALVRNVAGLQEQVAAAADHVHRAQTGQQQEEQLQTRLSYLQPQLACAQQALRNAQDTLDTLQEEETLETDDMKQQDGQHDTSGMTTARLQHLWSVCQARTSVLRRSCQEVEGRLNMATSDLAWQEKELDRLEEKHVRLDPSVANISTAALSKQRHVLEERIRIASDQSRAMSVRIKVLGGTTSTSEKQYQAVNLPAPLHTLFSIPHRPALTGKPTGRLASASTIAKPSTAPICKDVAAAASSATPPAEHWAHALGVVCGGNLDVIVTRTSSQARDVLRAPPSITSSASGRGVMRPGQSQRLRIWPLDRITFKDLCEKQRAAQTALGASKVVLPLDLLDYPPDVHHAMVKAVGGYMLAADSSTAAVLAQRYGLASVTPDGTTSRRGTVQGGCKNNGRRGTEPEEVMMKKVELGHVMAQHATLSAQLQTDRDALMTIQQQIKAVSAVEASVQQVHQAKDMVCRLQQQVISLKAELVPWHEQLQHAQDEEQRYRELCSAHGDPQPHHNHHYKSSPSSKPSNKATLHQQLLAAAQQQVCCHAATVSTLSGQIQTLEDQLLELESERHMLMSEKDEMGQQSKGEDMMSKAWPVGAFQLRYDCLKSELDKMQEDLSTVRQQKVEADKRSTDAQASIHQLHQHSNDLRKRVRSQVKVIKEKEEYIKTKRTELDKVCALVFDLRKQYGIPSHATTLSSEDVDQDVNVFKDKLKQLSKAKQVVEAAGAKAWTLVESKACDARREDVAVFQQHVKALAAASDALDQGITISRQEVLATHAAISQAVGTRFQELCSALLPGMCFTLGSAATSAGKRPNTAGEAGLAYIILYRRDHDTGLIVQEEGIEGSGEWMSDLEQLSGGQRTLVSLALLLAAALEGSCSDVLLLDEVDAALDEANQAAVAQLLHALAHGKFSTTAVHCTITTGQQRHRQGLRANDIRRAGGMQVMCVSHHVAFQTVCDAQVKISCKEGGTVAGK